MSTLFRKSGIDGAAGRGWKLSLDLSMLQLSLQQAHVRAQREMKDILVCYTFAFPALDALIVWSAFRQLFGTDAIFWERPEKQHAIVGSKPLLSIETEGEERFQAASQAWRHIVQDVVVGGLPQHGPVMFGGFTFDAATPHTQHWQDFPPGLLLLPSFLFQQRQQDASLSINLLVSATENPQERLSQIEYDLSRLEQTIQTISIPVAGPRSVHLEQKELLAADIWQHIVAESVVEMQAGEYDKVALARALEVYGDFQIEAVLTYLRRHYPSAYVFAWSRAKKIFVAATPERLIYGQNGELQTIALASSAARGATEEEDRRLAEELLHSKKTRQEHQIVVDSILEGLQTLCSNVRSEATPHLLRLQNIQHLETTIVGDLLPGRCVLDAIALLHPTPAVGGFPRARALEIIRQREQLERGWYASPIGWIDQDGNGEFAVALRSALLTPDRAVLFAGCGIVADSEPLKEYQESWMKFDVMLGALAKGNATYLDSE